MRITTNKNRHRVAIIGGGFCGLSVMAHLVRTAKAGDQPIDIVLFDPSESVGGSVFRETLPDTYLLNHEADSMGAVNPYSAEAQNDDFYLWLQQNKHRHLSGQRFTGTIARRYKNFDLDDPKAYLPRNLYGVYLEQRYKDLGKAAANTDINILHKRVSVDDIAQEQGGWNVVSTSGKEFFDIVVLSTGSRYPKGEPGMLQSQYPESFLGNDTSTPAKSVALLGSSLSAVEAALSLANMGHSEITLYSRNRRLPKVRGEAKAYKPALSLAKLEAACGPDGLIPLGTLARLLKEEFDRAYKGHGGHYQNKGINWVEVLENRDPLMQLTQDIDIATSEQEIRWRSVIFSFLDLEVAMWERLSLDDKRYVLDRYCSLLLSYLAPMPLPQARLLRRYLGEGTIRLRGVTAYERSDAGWRITEGNGASQQYDCLIDARGPLWDVSDTPLIRRLLDSGVLTRHTFGGVEVESSTFRAIGSDKKVHAGLYAAGAPVFGARPLQTSTLFYADFCRTVARSIDRAVFSKG